VLADLDRTVFAVVGSGGRPGSWTWLRELVTHPGPSGPVLRAAAGGPVTTAADLPRSRVEAAELLTVLAPGEAAVFEEAWVPVTVARAAAALDPGSLGGPVATLARHDEERGTGYVETLGAWLGHLGEPRRAAQALHVHVITLRHRMRRITALVDLDLGDPRERLALQLQIEAFRTRGRPGAASMDR
jgi:sugar diacid utilization regulator